MILPIKYFSMTRLNKLYIFLYKLNPILGFYPCKIVQLSYAVNWPNQLVICTAVKNIAFFSKFFSCLQKPLYFSFLKLLLVWTEATHARSFLKFWISTSKCKISLMFNIQDSSSVTPILSLFFQLAWKFSAILDRGAISLANAQKNKSPSFVPPIQPSK